MRESRPPVPAAAGSSLDTVTTSGREAASKLPGRDTTHQIELPGMEDLEDFTEFRPLSRPERRRLTRSQSPCCSTKLVCVGHDPDGSIHWCRNCGALYLFEDGDTGFAVIDSRTNSPIRLTAAPPP